MIENVNIALFGERLHGFELQMMSTHMGDMYLWLVILVVVVVIAVVVPLALLTYPRKAYSGAGSTQPKTVSSVSIPTNAIVPAATQTKEQVSRVDELAKALELVRPTLNDDERRVLGEIVKAGGQVLQSDLPEKSDFSKATVSKVVKSLETMGIVTREKHKWTYWVRISDKLISRSMNA